MATLTYTRLETHPDGTAAIAGIVNGNWERMELVFSPVLTTADLSYNAFYKALTRNATLPASNGAAIQWDNTLGTPKPITRPGIATGTGAAPAIDVKGAMVLDYTLTGDPTFSTTNRAAGWRVSAVVRAGGATRTLTFPSWVWIGSAAPATLDSGKVALLELVCTDGNDTGILARWTVQP